MKRKGMLLGAVLLLLLSGQAHAAYKAVEATVLEATLYVNKKMVQMYDYDRDWSTKKELPVLMYQDRTYVPLRKLAEKMGAVVGYDPETQEVRIDQPSYLPVKSAASRSDVNEDFKLTLYTAKLEYAIGEPIQIWSRVSNETEQEKKVFHSFSMVYYSITDENGLLSPPMELFSLETSAFQPGDEYRTQLLPEDLYQYNLNRLGPGAMKKLDQSPQPAQLPKGKYTVTAMAGYSTDNRNLDGTQHKLSASIDITVK
ncbi:stalk domain-containing protein [Gorillibacterium sp. sgz5001074]|uniref:stalk domain-containing protein n=1 Tax=Gorillibacterium sp. sgz5001074 TaxID=3446695 RepID=UPI003F665EB6